MAPLRASTLDKRLRIVAAILAVALLVASCTPSANEPTGPAPAQQSVTEHPTAEPPSFTPSSAIESLTLNHVFKRDALPGYDLDPSRIRMIVATGDIIPARMTNWQMVQKNDFTYPFAPTVDLLRNANLTIVNLESPLVKGCQPTMQGMVFCGDQRFVGGLTYAQIDIASLANNHSDNYGGAGISQTVELLAQNGIDVIGTGNSLIKDVKGLRFGFLAFNGVGTRFDRTAIRQAIAVLRPQVDVLVVGMHWGKEYVAVPEASPGVAEDNPREMAQFVVDAGADLIIGNHPHWVQGIELYKGKLITYAHGNFIFDQMWSQETREGVLGKYTFYDSQLINAEFFPVVIEDYAQPRFPDEAGKATILDRMETASRQIAVSTQQSAIRHGQR